MKKLLLAASLTLLLVSVSIAQTANYQIYSESKGFLGLGGRKVIMLNKDTGDSWLYYNNKWIPIPRVEEEEVSQKSEEINVRAIMEEENKIKANQEQEINTLKAKQEDELKAIKAKQEAELKALMAKQEEEVKAKPAVKTITQTKERRIYRPRVSVTRKKLAPPPNSAGEDEGNTPPDWLKD